MKKYNQPLTETEELAVSTVIAMSQVNAIGTDGWHGKSRDDQEDEEAYAATEGAGEAQYGDLW